MQADNDKGKRNCRLTCASSDRINARRPRVQLPILHTPLTYGPDQEKAMRVAGYEALNMTGTRDSVRTTEYAPAKHLRHSTSPSSPSTTLHCTALHCPDLLCTSRPASRPSSRLTTWKLSPCLNHPPIRSGR
eukprot:TRINITY_DN680_c0_g2_i1.p1 TRINITY_DN680_c0_g2~~TRINITY_DN680_c0_g2_i1.p1  ORF type:complete len:132 (-),score=4.06 TRINITY_DN680_c0_g2_i1:448-843(-)